MAVPAWIVGRAGGLVWLCGVQELVGGITILKQPRVVEVIRSTFQAGCRLNRLIVLFGRKGRHSIHPGRFLILHRCFISSANAMRRQERRLSCAPYGILPPADG